MMKLHNVLITIIIVSMITLGCITFINELGDSYSVTADMSTFEDTNKTLVEYNNKTQGLSNDLNNLTLIEGEGLLEIPYELLKTGWSSAKVIFGSWSVVGTMIGDLFTSFQENGGITLPDWLAPSIIAIIIVLLVSMIIYAFFKWEFKV